LNTVGTVPVRYALLLGIGKYGRLCRMSISDVFKSLATGFSVAGRVEAGFVMREDRVLCQPLNQLCTVKGVLVEQADSQTG
jgi:translation elongation factor EF-1alpha